MKKFILLIVVLAVGAAIVIGVSVSRNKSNSEKISEDSKAVGAATKDMATDIAQATAQTATQIATNVAAKSVVIATNVAAQVKEVTTNVAGQVKDKVNDLMNH